MMKILLAVDGTKYSQAAVDMIARFSFLSESEITIVSVIDLMIPFSIDTYTGYVPPIAELEKSAREHAEKVLANTKQSIFEKLGEVKVSIKTDILIGSPESKIVETAENINADLIVVGSHGYYRWERLLLGSVSDSIVHHAPCSVLVVRIPKE